MFVSETYVVEDCTYYNVNSVTSTTTVSIPLPSAFEISFITKRTSGSSNYAYLEIGGNSGNTALFGQVGGAGVNQIRIYNSEGSSSYDTYFTDNTPLSSDALQKWSHNGSSNTFSMNSSSTSFTDSKSHSKIRKITISNNRCEKLKVKPL